MSTAQRRGGPADAKPPATPSKPKTDDDVVVEVVDEGWGEPDDPSPEAGEVPRLTDSMPPDEVTHLSDLARLARVLDMNAIARLRVSPEAAGVPVPEPARHLLGFIDGRSSLQKIVDNSGLTEDVALQALAFLQQNGLIAIL